MLLKYTRLVTLLWFEKKLVSLEKNYVKCQSKFSAILAIFSVIWIYSKRGYPT